MSQKVLIHPLIEMRLTRRVSQVATDEVAPAPLRCAQHDEGTRCRIDDEIAGLGDGGDEVFC
jgi:hypothetical protein